MSKKIDYLESLRGVAALVVVFGHFMLAFYPALWWGLPGLVHTKSGAELFIKGTPLNLLYNGAFSVSIFFVLSGFVLTYGFFRDRSARMALVPAAAKRYTRLLLPILASNAVAFLLLQAGLFQNQPVSAATASGWFSGFWKADTGFFRMLYESLYGVYFNKKSISLNNILWTMSYEFFGSLVVYLFVILFGRYRRRDWVYALAIVSFGRSYYLAFILGMVLSDLATRERNIFHAVRHKGYFVALLLIGLFMGSYPSEAPLPGTLYAGLARVMNVRTSQIIGAALVMIALLNSRRLQTLFSKRPFLFLGRISFSLYVLHLLVIGSLLSMLFLKTLPALSYHGAAAAAFIITLPLLFVLSHYMHRFVDAPGISASQAVYGRARKEMQAVAGALLRLAPASGAWRRVLAVLFDPTAEDAPGTGNGRP
jgi:peptidoglycan/LPS O-acetylase OafA/YrhL